MSVIDNVVELRKKLAYSQEEIADKLGVSRQTYSKMENKELYRKLCSLQKEEQ